MQEESQKFLVFLVAGIIFLILLVVMLLILSKTAPDVITNVINYVKGSLGL